MKRDHGTAVILCGCSGIIAERIDWQNVQAQLSAHPAAPALCVDELACGADNLERLGEWLRSERPERLVVAACSPREHEATFRKLMVDAGLNPYQMQLVNVREQAAWVTADPAEATAKATRLIAAALNRVQQQPPLAARRMAVRTDVAVIGAGPAGMQAAQTLANAGRRVTLIDREPFIGGLPVRFEDLFPDLDCAPCLLEPIMGDLLHGAASAQVDLFTEAEVVAVKGGFGDFRLTLRQAARFVDAGLCIGCQECIAACPARRPHPWDGRGELPAIALPFAGALPNVPHVAGDACRRLQGDDCDACIGQCPVPGALDFAAAPREFEVAAGAVVVATGAEEKQARPPAFAGLADVHTAYEFERLLAMNGPTGGALQKADGTPPQSLAIVHCAGSLDADEIPYCSETCCRDAVKFAQLAAHKSAATQTTVTRLVREQVVPGVAAGRQWRADPASTVRYDGIGHLRVDGEGTARRLVNTATGDAVAADMIVLMRPLLPGAGTAAARRVLELATDDAGFLAPAHPLSAACAAPQQGIYFAGSCRGPGDIRAAMTSGTAAAGLALSALVEGRDLVVDPQVATVDAARCAGCGTCPPLCPYKAISWQADTRTAWIEDALCRGCGTCVAACPSGAIRGNGFTRDMLRAELEGILSC